MPVVMTGVGCGTILMAAAISVLVVWAVVMVVRWLW